MYSPTNAHRSRSFDVPRADRPGAPLVNNNINTVDTGAHRDDPRPIQSVRLDTRAMSHGGESSRLGIHQKEQIPSPTRDAGSSSSHIGRGGNDAGYAGYGSGQGEYDGRGAGVYDTRLVSRTLSHTQSNPQTQTSSPVPRHSSTRASPIPKQAPALTSTPAASTNTTPQMMAGGWSGQAGYGNEAGPSASRIASRANSSSTHDWSSGTAYQRSPSSRTGQHPTSAAGWSERAEDGRAAQGSLAMARSGSAGTESMQSATRQARAAYSPPSSSAASVHSGRTDGGSSARVGGGAAHGSSYHHAPAIADSYPLPPSATSAGVAARGSYSFSRGPSTPSVPALSLTAATPSAPAPLAPHEPSFATGGSRAYSPATSAASGSGGSGSGASSGLGLARGSISQTGGSRSGTNSAAGGGGDRGGGVLSASAALLQAQGEFTRNAARTIRGALEHSSPNSPWSQLTVHALPVFTGSTVKTSMENLNRLCTNHITATNQRTAQSKVTAVLIADLREFIASGMLTLKTRLEGDDMGLLERMSETWFFFWTRVLGYIEGVFLPFSKIQSTPAIDSPMPYSLIPVRQLLLSGFMYHTLIPSLPQLLSLISAPDDSIGIAPNASASSFSPPSTSEMVLRRLQQMTLILANQASYSAIRPPAAGHDTTAQDAAAIAEAVDRDVKDQLEELAGAVKWKLDQIAGKASGASGTALNAGAAADSRNGATGSGTMPARRRKGWRASLAPGTGIGTAGLSLAQPSSNGRAHVLTRAGRQASDLTTNTHGSGTMSNQTHGSGQPSSRWGPQRGHETEEEDHPRGQRQDTGYGVQYEQEYGYDEDEDDEGTIPAQSRNASIALDGGIARFGHTRQSSDQSHMRRSSQAYHQRRGSEHDWREGGASLGTAPSTLTASGTFKLGGVVGAAAADGEDDMTPTVAPHLSGRMGRRGSDVGGHRRAAQRA